MSEPFEKFVVHTQTPSEFRIYVGSPSEPLVSKQQWDLDRDATVRRDFIEAAINEKLLRERSAPQKEG